MLLVALNQLHATRDSYSSTLRHAQTNLANDGYDPTSTFGADAHEAETPDQARQDVTDALAGDKGAASRVNGVLNSITRPPTRRISPHRLPHAAAFSGVAGHERGIVTIRRP
ncbi:hypothetical protein MAHJHV61_16300 [Mycobacterium avium subsp. hominissuis]|nr:hypothetical protein L837_0483 [Mycobacterium avium MAV_061107_1842]